MSYIYANQPIHMKRSILYCLLLLVITISKENTLNAQNLDEELGFIYVKAEYLFSTGRFEDAVPLYNQVIVKEPRYKDALLHRGECKFALAAYKGAKADALQSIEVKGITADAAALLGRSFGQMRDFDPALSSLSAAIGLNPENDTYLVWRAALYEQQGSLLKACHDYEAAMRLGNDEAMVKARNLCGISGNTQTHPTHVPPSTSNTSTDDGQLKDDEVLSASNEDQPSKTSTTEVGSFGDTIVVTQVPPVIDPNLPKDDNFINKIKIDDDVSIDIFGQELGRRQIEEVPSILILSEENGKVAVHICVNKNGDVTKAEFDPSNSTIAKKSLVSLAIRKAKEFVFKSGKYDSQCGQMVFFISGS